MFCSNCGTKIGNDVKFCFECGSKKFTIQKEEEVKEAIIKEDEIAQSRIKITASEQINQKLME